MRSAIISGCPMTTCRFNGLQLAVPLLLSASPVFAGHAGEVESQSLLPHELLIGLVGLAGLVLFALLALAWVIRRVRGLDRRLQDLEGGRKN